MQEIILAAHIYLVSSFSQTPCHMPNIDGCIVWVTPPEIYILNTRLIEDQYMTLWHEEGHNIMKPYWKVPVNLFKDEEERADYFSWWILGKKQGIQYTNKDVNRYFSEKCNKACVKTILNLKLQ